MAEKPDGRVVASIELCLVEENRPHRSAPDVRVRVFACGCQLNDRGGTITNAWLCQYHDGFRDGLEAGDDAS